MNLSSGCIRFSQLTLIVSALFFAGCGSAPAPTQTRAPVHNKPSNVPVVESLQSPESLLADAKNIWENEHDAVKRNKHLLDAAALYMQEAETVKAQQILVSLKQESLNSEQSSRLNLYIAMTYLNQSSVNDNDLLELVTPLSTKPAIRKQQQAIRATLYERQHNWMAAADAYVEAYEPSDEFVQQVWSWINMATPQERQHAQAKYATLRPYLALYDLVSTEGLSPASLRQALAQFNQVYRGHPISEFMPTEVVAGASIQAEAPRQVVVLLPLSGKLATTGTTIKEGLLSAYYDNAARQRSGDMPVELNFVDTVNKSADELLSAISGYKWVIGPLLKENVEAIIHRIPVGTHLLALNRADAPVDIAPTEGAVNTESSASALPPLANITKQASEVLGVTSLNAKDNAFFALAPEDEATQLANYIYQNGYKTPIVVSAQNSINQRMENAFTARWQALNDNRAKNKKVKLTSVRFTDSNSLREGITQSLDVAQSHDRIQQIEYMVNEKLYNVPRNRRDVDAIIVFASPEQTELLNPMVEASLSPFNGQTVPVFATSRSIEYDDTKNQWRDLQNVRFLDMPWMMPNNQWQTLQTQAQSLWPQRNTQMSRLFAFGVDAYNLLPHVPSMKALPQTQISGLTGTLSIDENGDVVRTLPQAIIDNQAIRLLNDSQASSAGR